MALFRNLDDAALSTRVTSGRIGGTRSSATSTPVVALVVLTLLALVLRLYRLDGQSLWLDEVSSLRDARVLDTLGLHALARVDQVAPLHAALLVLAMTIGDAGEAALRMPSVITSALTVPALYWSVHRLFGLRSVALASAGLLAISPFALWYAQEARMYAAVILAATLYVGLVWPVVTRPLTAVELVLVTLVTALGLLLHHFMALVGVAFGVILLANGLAFRGRALAWAATQVVAALPFVYWLTLTMQSGGNAAGNAKPSALLWAPYTFYSFLAGQSFGPSPTDLAAAGAGAARLAAAHAPAILLLAAGSLIVGVAGLRAMFAHRPRTAGWWIMAWLLVPLALTMLVTALTPVEFNVRYVAVSQPAAMVVLGFGLTAVLAYLRSPSRRPLGALVAAGGGAALVGCLLFALGQHYHNPTYAKADVRTFSQALDRLPANAVIVADNNRISKMLGYYGGRKLPTALQVNYNYRSLSPEAVWRTARSVQPSGDIWLIEYRSWEADPRGYLPAQLARAGQQVGVATWPGITLRHYRLHQRG